MNLVDDEALLAMLLAEERETEATEVATAGAPAAASRDTTAPLSEEQQALWFVQALDPRSPAYIMSAAFTIAGDLAADALVRAFARVADRHDTLRTAFVVCDGIVSQRAEETIELPVRSIDGRAPGFDLEALIHRESVEPFDLTTPPLWRVKIVWVAEARHVVTIAIHHLLADAISVDRLLADVGYAYARECGAALPAPGPLRLQFGDYARAQRDALTPARRERQLAFWVDRLQGVAALELPTDRPRPRTPSFSGGQVEVAIDPALAQAIESLARAARTTPYVVFLAAFAALLQRYTRQTAFAIGTSYANRSAPEHDAVIGLFAKLLVFRCDLSDDPPFRELVDAMRTTVFDALENADVSFDAIVDRLHVERDGSRSPLFQAALSVFHLGANEGGFAGLSVTPAATQNAARFDLEVFLRKTAEGYTGTIVFARDLFDASTIAAFRDAFVMLLREACARPDRPITTIPVLDESEATAPGATFAVAETLPEAFDRVAAAHASRPALRFGAETLAYAELGRRADAIATALAEAGTKPGDFVGLSAARGFALIVGMLGILKAGAAYVPLDPAYPAERLVLVAADAGVAVIVTDGLPLSPALAEGRTIVRADAVASPPTGDPTRTAPSDPEAAAYLIHTSGSTGTPKGVVVSHANVVRLFAASAEHFTFRASDVWTLAHSYAFDFSVWEIWGALLHGGTLVIVPLAVVADADAFYALLCDERVTVLNQTPGAFKRLVAAEERLVREAEICLRYVVFGGEALDPRSLVPWFDRHGEDQPRLINMYGITETTVHVTARRIGLRDAVSARSSPIGVPLADLSLALVNEALLPVPIGALGELVVGGAGVAGGYIGRPALTAERFLPDPANARGRRYRSGDLARRTADGEIDYRGRIDTQIKLRGFRIEPAEIAAVIAEHGLVRDAVVVVDGEGDGRRLVAYAVPGPDFLVRADDGARSAQIDAWTQTFDTVYAERALDLDQPDFRGWESSFTGEPIPERAMRAWLDETVERLRALGPKRVLEIGCGTGMLLAALAPEVGAYDALDLSAPTVAMLQQLVEARGWTHVRLVDGDALGGLEKLLGTAPFAGEPYDVVVVNSVVQYFPAADYLADVLRRVVPAVAPGGAIFLGDLRTAASLRLTHCAFEAARLGAGAEIDVLRAHIDRATRREAELLLDPGWFARVDLDRDFALEPRMKDTGADSEMARFRYDLVMRFDAAAPPACEVPSVVAATLDDDGALETLLRADPTAPLLLRNARNARIAAEVALLGAVDGGTEPFGALFDPARLAALAARLGRPYAACFSPGSANVAFDAALGAVGAAAAPALPIATASGLASETDANAPLDARNRARFVRMLRAHTADRLPAYMVPSEIVMLDAIPLTRTGKLDRAALPAAERTAVAQAGFVAPTTPTEIVVAAAFAEVLRLDRASAREHFFESGGHSLLATHLATRLRDQLGVSVPLRLVFERPIVADLAAALAASEAEEPAGGRVLPRDRRHAERAPLSLGQARLLFLHALLADPSIYNVQVAMRLRGALDESALAGAIADVVARHEILRTRYEHDGTAQVQVIEPPTAPDFRAIDLAQEDPGARFAAARVAIARDVATPFALDAGPIMRSRLYRLGADDAALSITLHHIACDGWSMRVLTEELAACYAARRAARPHALPAVPLQYADYAVAQAGDAAGERRQRALANRRERLAGSPVAVTLRTDRPRPIQPTTRGTSVWFAIPAEVAARIGVTTGAERATPFMFFAAVLAFVVAASGGDREIVIGTATANRSRPELESIVGFFVNTLPLRIAVAEYATARALLRAVCETALDAYAHQEVPFESIVDALGAPRRLGRHPLFQVMLTLQNQDAADVRFAGVTTESLGDGDQGAKFDLDCTIGFRDGAYAGILTGAADLFDRATLQAYADAFVAAVAAFSADPDAVLDDLARAVLPARLAPTAMNDAIASEDAAQPSPLGVVPSASMPFAKRALTSDETTMLALWRTVLPDVPADPDADYFDLGGTSLVLMRLNGLIKERFGNGVPFATVYASPTLAAFARLAREASARTESALVVLNAAPSDAPILTLFHDVSGRVLSYVPLARALAGRVSAIALQTAGEGAPRATGLEGTVAALVAALRAHQPRGPYHLAGHSLGGLFAFEAARQLLASGDAVGSLTILDGLGPAACGSLRVIEDPAERLAAIAQSLAAFFEVTVELRLEDLAPLDPDSRVDLTLERLLAAGLPRDLVGGDQARTLLRVYEQMQRDVAAYAPLPIDMPATLYRSEAANAAAGPQAWAGFVRNLDVRYATGDHIGMVKAPAVETLAAELVASLLGEKG